MQALRDARRTHLREALAAAVLLTSLAVWAGPDTHYLGDGSDGAFPPTGVTPTNYLVNSYAPVTQGLLPGEQQILIGSVRLSASNRTFASGDLVMVLQTTGLVPPAAYGQEAPLDLSSDAVGRWELARLSSVSGSTLTLSAPLLHSYASGVTQVILVPEYSSVTLASGQSIVAADWDGATGGVVAFLVQGAISNAGTISATGKGFRGGSYTDDNNDPDSCTGASESSPDVGKKGEGVDSTRYGATSSLGRGNSTHGGGGGACVRAGGGGGANAGRGGQGGKATNGNVVGGMGGAPLVYSMLRSLTLGGGGGSGHGRHNGSATAQSSGGRGGGLVLIRAQSLSGAGSIEASGGSGLGGGGNNDGAGGGGAGGTIVVRLAAGMACGSITASGGAGGNAATTGTAPNTTSRGPGGGGGGGRVLYQAATSPCSINVNSGQAGTADAAGHYGATPPAGDVGLSPFAGLITQLPGGLPDLSARSVTITNPSSTSSSSPTLTSNRRESITGTAPANNLVVVYLNGAEIGRVTSSGAGAFTLGLTSDLFDGLYKVEAAVVEPTQGLQGPLSTASYRRVDSVAPTSPVLTSLATKPLASNMLVNTTTPAVAGRAEPGSTVLVTIIKTADNTAVVTDRPMTGTVALDGTWTWANYPSGVALVHDQNYKLTAKARDAANNVSAASEDLYFKVDTQTSTPTLTHLEGVALATSRRTRSTRPSLQGTAEAGSTVSVAVRDSSNEVKASGDAVANSSGQWMWVWPTGTTALAGSANGISYTVKATAIDAADNSSPTEMSEPFTVDTSTPTPTLLTLDSKGVANGMRIKGQTPGLTGTAEKDSTIDVYIDGAKLGLSPSATGSTGDTAVGSWTWAYPTGEGAPAPLTEGLHSLEVVATDVAGNTSARSGTLFFHVDRSTPVPQVLKLGGAPAAEGMRINSTTPGAEGTAEAGSTVTVSVKLKSGGGDLASTSVTAGANGSWTWPWPAGVNALTDEQYTLTVEAEDGAGNIAERTLTFTVDTAVSPPLRITLVGNRGPVPPAAEVASSLAINVLRPLVRGAVEPGSLVTVEFFDAATLAGRVEVTADATSGEWLAPLATDLTAGRTYTLKVSAEDVAGNAGGHSDVTVQVDNMDPNTGITSAPPQFGAPADVSFTLACTDEVGGSGCAARLQCSLNGGAFEPCDPTWSLGSLSNGDYYLLVRALDNAGNEDATPASYFFRVTGGVFGFDMSTPPNPSNINPVTFEFLPTRDVAVSYLCSLQLLGDQASLPEPCPILDPNAPNRAEFVLPQDGTYILNVEATVPSTGESATSAPYSWTYDSTPPLQPSITYPPNAAKLNDPGLTVRGTVPLRPATDSRKDRPGEAIIVEITVGSREPVTSSVDPNTREWNFPVPLLPDGTHSVSVRSRDDARNWSESAVTISFTVDTRPPRITDVQNRPGSLSNSSSISMTFLADELSVRYYCYLDEEPVAETDSHLCQQGGGGTYTASRLSEGAHVFYVRARDEAGNFGPAAAVAWTVDTVPPETSLRSVPNPRTNLVDATFEFESEPGATFECLLDAAVDYKLCDTNDFKGLAEGAHELLVRAVDRAGNRDASPASYRWEIDITPPGMPVVLAPAERGVLSTGLPEVRGTAEPGSLVSVSLSGSKVAEALVEANGQWVATLALQSYVDGEYILSVTATDTATNTGPASEPRDVRVDATPPETEIISGPQGRVTTPEATFELLAPGEVGASFLCSLDNEPYAPCPSPMTYPGLAEGAHVLKVAAVDEARNTDPTPASRNWRVYLGSDSRALGGGLSCASTPAASSESGWLGLVGLLTLLARRRKA